MAVDRPNVIIILTDDQGYGDLGCHGNPVADTPHLDALHAGSVRLEDFHVAPMCTPTRGQLLTGLDAARNGAVNVSSGRALLRPELPTMADRFREAGYRTGVFGKWHLGDNYPFRPQDRGFEETLWFPSSHISSLPDYWQNDYFDDVYRRGDEQVRMEGYCTQVFFREARDWMRSRIERDEPFFAYLPTNAPHYPWFVPSGDREAIAARIAERGGELPALAEMPEDRRDSLCRFLAMIRNLDREIGALRAFLEESGVAEDTVIVFMTDNGSTFGPAYYNAGMRGGKVTLWEGGHRVPCFIRWPGGGIDQGRDIHGLTQVQDILPTLAAWCDLDLDADAIDGVSLDPALRGGEPVPDRTLCVNYTRMPKTDYPTPASSAVMRREGAAVMWRRWRLLEGTALYDLATDPEQQTNLIEQRPEIAARLKAELDRWWAAVEPIANQAQRVIIGSEHEPATTLTGCEWWDVFLDQQFQVRHGVHKNSYWHLEVARAGRYRFDLRRWPEEAGLALADNCPAATLTDGELGAGVALPIAGARILIGDHDRRIATSADDRAASFELDLTPGETLLHTWFLDPRGEPITGAYYVAVAYLG